MEVDYLAQFKSSLLIVQQRIDLAARRSNRTAEEITILAVTKTHGPALVSAALDAGLNEIGENRVQEAERKAGLIDGRGRLHLIGHLQSNKVRKAVAVCDMIQSVDSASLAQEINKRASETGKRIDILIEINSSGEPQKFGIGFSQLSSLAETCASLPSLRLRGLMTIGPLTESTDQITRSFAATADAFDSLQRQLGKQIDCLSMGMSGDFELAIEHGSTMIRLGSVLFGSRR